MARRPRLDFAGVPQHLVQRGVNRQTCFVDDADRRRLLGLLLECTRTHELAIHAFVLMNNHIHLLATPARDGAVSRTMRDAGSAYALAYNKRHSRTGALFEGRYHSSLIRTERYLLCCHRYIELNPVRAGIVAYPSEYPWSSYACNALGSSDPLISPHPALPPPELYRQFVSEGSSTLQDDDATIRAHLRNGTEVGTPMRGPGRPRAK